jgi:acylphosphatase
MTHVARRYFVSGDVQGVGFRYFVLRETQRIGELRGFVRNLRDGRVETYAEGEERKLMELEESLKQGPRGSYVSGVEVQDEIPRGNHDGFRITS